MWHAVGASSASFRPWGEHLPTDSQLILGLFATYLDGRLTTKSMVGTSVEQPFTYAYILNHMAKPNALQSSTDAFYIHVVSN